ncbi:hypothetical protein ACFOD0_03770 [Shewanella intestini]|uniref:Cobalamin-independent methionine synthase MetE C-terminal/archaeal domain-containing protein n=1 Tax=Shewanella intestini TaxID=2017544 RepID=A0ABS5I3B1_9GAMM|nr:MULTISPECIES: hypothetical protein [Shewanella]MBR9728517.1 hypothetical protein [Shewanella intestini]MRG36336.1 hypothetical protein [Shewanella sp. XMDDZSB0408]
MGWPLPKIFGSNIIVHAALNRHCSMLISSLQAMTFEWRTYAPSLMNKPLKGILTGLVIILYWLFAREDIYSPNISQVVDIINRI